MYPHPIYSSSLVTVWFTSSALRALHSAYNIYLTLTLSLLRKEWRKRSFFVGLHGPYNYHDPSEETAKGVGMGWKDSFLLWKVGQKKSFPTRLVGLLHIPTFLPSFPNLFQIFLHLGIPPQVFFAHSSKVTGGPIKEWLVFQPSIYLKGANS